MAGPDSCRWDRVGRLRRLAAIALEDFGLRRAPQPPALVVVRAQATVAEEAEPGLPPGVVWQGQAARRPELQRFVDHLESKRAAAFADS